MKVFIPGDADRGGGPALQRAEDRILPVEAGDAAGKALHSLDEKRIKAVETPIGGILPEAENRAEIRLRKEAAEGRRHRIPLPIPQSFRKEISLSFPFRYRIPEGPVALHRDPSPA